MTLSRSLRAVALLLALLTIFSLCGCAATRPVRAASIAQRAVATAGGASYGVEITNNGFKVRNTDSETVKGFSPFLNELGTTFFYIAFK